MPLTLNYRPSTLMTEITSLVKQEADLYSVDPFLPGHESSLKSTRIILGWTRIPYLFLKIPGSKWRRQGVPCAVKEQIVHLLERFNDLANFSLLSFHVLGIGASYTRGMGLTGAPSQMLSLPPLSLATHSLLSKLTCGTSRAQSYAGPFLGLDTVICQITQKGNKSSWGWLYFAHGLLQHMVPSVVERGWGGQNCLTRQ